MMNKNLASVDSLQKKEARAVELKARSAVKPDYTQSLAV